MIDGSCGVCSHLLYLYCETTAPGSRPCCDDERHCVLLCAWYVVAIMRTALLATICVCGSGIKADDRVV